MTTIFQVPVGTPVAPYYPHQKYNIQTFTPETEVYIDNLGLIYYLDIVDRITARVWYFEPSETGITRLRKYDETTYEATRFYKIPLNNFKFGFYVNVENVRQL